MKQDALTRCIVHCETNIPVGKAFNHLQLEEGEVKEENVLPLSHGCDLVNEVSTASIDTETIEAKVDLLKKWRMLMR